MSEASAGDDTELRGPARRRARTRAALLRAGRQLLARGREQASIEEITRLAGVGFGSFFNHFPDGKDDFFAEAVLEVLDGYAQWIRAATATVSDPAERFAISFRLSGRLATAQADLVAPLLSRGTELLLVRRGLREVALADLVQGVREGRFHDLDPEVHLMAVGGVLLGLVRMCVDSPGLMNEAVVDRVTAGGLRLLGVEQAEADRLVGLPLPDQPDLMVG